VDGACDIPKQLVGWRLEIGGYVASGVHPRLNLGQLGRPRQLHREPFDVIASVKDDVVGDDPTAAMNIGVAHAEQPLNPPRRTGIGVALLDVCQ
jgi:hypothetical protein